jgi:hypothetical protein
MKTCATCALWKPDRPIGSLIRTGGKCYYKGETKLDYSCWWWREAAPEELEARAKAGLIEE